MSLLRACKQASSLPRQPWSQPSLINRHISIAPQPTKSDNEKPSSDIVAPETRVSREVMVADVISGAPSQLRHRSVHVYQPTRSTMQSGSGKSERWRIDFDVLPGGSGWENPLMGWASSADYMQGTRLSFKTKEDAIHFAEKQGWDCHAQPPTVKRIPPKNYAENYVYKPHKLRIMRTK